MVILSRKLEIKKGKLQLGISAALSISFTTIRTVPLAILIGVPLVTISYLLVNVTFFAILSHDQILSSDAVALVM